MAKYPKLSRLVIRAGNVNLIGTEVTGKGFKSLCPANLANYVSQAVNLSIESDRGASVPLVGTIQSCVPQSGSYLIDMEFDQDAFYTFMDLVK